MPVLQCERSWCTSCCQIFRANLGAFGFVASTLGPTSGPADVDAALEEVETMRAELSAANEAPQGGLYGLKFMQRALARKKAAAQESLDELEADLNGGEPGRPRGPAADPGRRTFGATLKKQKSAPAFEAPDDWGDDGEGNDEVSAAAKPAKPAGAPSNVTKVATAVTVKLSNAEAFADVAAIEVPAEFVEPEPGTMQSTAKAAAIDPEVERASAENPWLTVGSNGNGKPGEGDAAAVQQLRFIFDHFSRVSQHHATPHAPCDGVMPVLVGC